MSNDIKEMAIYFANAILLVVAMIIVAFVILTTLGCSKKVNPCETCPEKIVEVYKPVPMKCDLNISLPPDVNTTSLQLMLDSTTKLILDGRKVRKEIIEVPCLKINYIK